MTEFTPGPWYLERRGAGSIVCASRARLREMSPGLTCLDVVARTDWGHGEEDEANARLIASAPDLLHALQMVRDANRDEPHIPPTALATIEAAIAKATGSGA